MKIKISIIGAGSWGTAIAKVLAEKPYNISLWAHEKEVCDVIKDKGENSIFLSGIPLSKNIITTNSLKDAVSGSTHIVVAVPTQFVRTVLTEIRPYITDVVHIISASKGIENDTLKTVSEIIKDVIPEIKTSILAGPTFAKEIALGKPAAVAISNKDRGEAENWRDIFMTNSFKVFINSDPIGVEVGGAIKNVIAIAAGISDGLFLGSNARAAIITRGLSETARLGMAMGAKFNTFLGLSGIGDMVLTCAGDLSRNRTVGMKLAQGKKISEIVSEMKMIAEGVKTAQSAYYLGKRYNVRMSIIDEVYYVIYEDKDINKAIKDLLDRNIVDEF